MTDTREARIRVAQDAAQQWWNEFCVDTGCHPDFVSGPFISANFHLVDAAAFFDAILEAVDGAAGVSVLSQDATETK